MQTPNGYTPMRTSFQIPLEHPDHPLQQMRRSGRTDPFALTQEDHARINQTLRAQGLQQALGEEDDKEDAGPTDCLCDQLILLSAFTHELQMQAHLLHLNYVGSNFLAVHAFLKGRYETHIEQFDTIAEFVRALGKPMPATHGELLAILPAFEHAMSTAECQLSNYSENLAHQACMATALESAAADQRQIDVANYMADLVADANKNQWFITATLS
jgi:DNA-binding ferritin-like protein